MGMVDPVRVAHATGGAACGGSVSDPAPREHDPRGAERPARMDPAIRAPRDDVRAAAPDDDATDDASEGEGASFDAPPPPRRAPPALVAIGLVAAALCVLPAGYLLVRAGGAGEATWRTLARPAVWGVLVDSLLLAGATTLGALAIGLPVAWLVTRTDLPGARYWNVALALPLAMPSYIMAYAFLGVLGPGGWLESALASAGLGSPQAIFREGGVFGDAGPFLELLLRTSSVLALINFPFVTLSARAAFQRMDPALEEAARGLGASRREVALRVLLPQLRPAIASGALLVALYTLSDFGTPALMRYRSFTRVIQTQYSTSFDRTGAAVTALMLATLTGAIVVAEVFARGGARAHRTTPASPRPPRILRLGRARRPAILFCSGVLAASVGMPTVAMLAWIRDGVANGGSLSIAPHLVGNSVLNATLAAVATVALAFPVVHLAVRYPGGISRAIDRATHVGNALPGIVVGLAFVFLGARIPALYQSLPLLIVAYVARFLPQATGAIRTSLLQLNPRLEEAGVSLGRSRAYVFATVTLPLALPGVLAGGALVFLTTIKELPITLLLRPTGEAHDTLVTEVWNAAQESLFSQASPPALLLVIVSAASIGLILRNDRRARPAAAQDATGAARS